VLYTPYNVVPKLHSKGNVWRIWDAYAVSNWKHISQCSGSGETIIQERAPYIVMGKQLRYKPGQNSGERALTRAEYEKCLLACSTQEDRVMLLIGVELGLRRRDIANIKLANIDLNEMKMSYYEHKKQRIRTVPMSPRLSQEIKILMNTIPKKRKTLFSYTSDRTVWNRLNKIFDQVGIENRGVHSLRGTCVKLRQQEGWTAEQTAKLIGDTVETVLNHYSTPSDDELAALIRGEKL
jgi:integrase